MANMVLPQVLYDSLLHRFRASLSYDGDVIAGFDPINAVDWRDFSLFTATVDPTAAVTLKIQIGAAVEPINSAVFWMLPASGAATAYVETSPDDSVWTTVATVAIPAAGGIVWADFAAVNVPAAGWMRVRLPSGSPYPITFRQISVGSRLTFPVGQWAGIAPPGLYSGVIVDNVTAVNGSILGRNIRRTEKSGKLDINLLEPTWVRSTFDPFQRHAARKAFWYRWHPTGFPTEVAFAAASDITAPINEKPTNRMRIEMSMRLLTE